MPEIGYPIRARIVVDPPRIDAIQRKMADLRSTMRKETTDIRKSVDNGFGSLITGGKIYAGVLALRGLVSTLSFAWRGVTEGIIESGSGLENTKMRLAQAISEGFAIGFQDARGYADAMFSYLRKRATDLPGTAQDAIDVGQGFIAAGARGGLDARAVADLAVNAAAFGLPKGFSGAQIGEQIRKALQENATFGESPLVAQKLGGRAEVDAFNALGPAERARQLAQVFGDIGEALDFAGQTWEANWSTLTDTIAQASERASAPAFEDLKNSVAEVNASLAGDQDGLDTAAIVAGEALRELVSPVTTVIEGVGTLADLFECENPVVAYSVRRLANAFGDVGLLVSDILTDLAPVAILVGPILEGFTKGLRFTLLLLETLGHGLAGAVLNMGRSGDEKHDFLADMGNELTTGIEDILFGQDKARAAALREDFARQMREREQQRKSDLDQLKRDREGQRKVEVKVKADVTWRDDESVAVSVQNAVEQAFDALARVPLSSGAAFPRYV